jgi:hypothetical protein
MTVPGKMSGYMPLKLSSVGDPYILFLRKTETGPASKWNMGMRSCPSEYVAQAVKNLFEAEEKRG